MQPDNRDNLKRHDGFSHTPEPWYDGRPLPDWVELKRSDYLRAVACVNALAGVPTEKLTPEVFNVLSLAIRARLEFGHNDTCGAALGEVSGTRYPCSCGHDQLGEAYEASGLGEP